MKRRPLALLTIAAAASVACQRQDTTSPLSANAAASQASAPTAASGASTPVAAASGPLIAPMAASAPTDADRHSGAQLAAQGGQGAPACASCHGAAGEGNAASGFPRIAGQSYRYLVHQLESYANDTRKNAVMAQIAKALNAAQRSQAAAYYASLAPNGVAAAGAPASAGSATAAARPASAPAGNARRGGELANVGDEAKWVQACANCHGPGGIGEGSIPYLAGQHADYLVSALNEWRDGSRSNDPTGQMPLIAKALSDADAQGVAAYFAQQSPPLRAIDAAAPAASAAAVAASAVTSGPRTPASGAASGATLQGTGTEQGSPLTGGGQGQGPGGGSGAGPSGSPSGDATTVPGSSSSSRTGKASGAASGASAAH